MVLANLVVYLLDKYLGDYIENLDTKKLKIDLWSGNVVLENLYLKSNALADLNLPVTISVGYLQKLTLQVPWKNLYTNPTKVTIDGVYLLVVPKTEVEYDAARDEKEQHEAKMRDLEKVEKLRKEKEEATDVQEQEKNNSTFLERTRLQVIRNLELSIRNLHIVYEDKSTKPGHPFAMGITLNYITLLTTTSSWEPTILKENTTLIHKLGELSALSIYWNSNAKSRSGLPRDEAVKNLRANIAIDNQQAPKDISYILRPLNVKARIILVMKPREENFQRPMFDIKVDLDEISLNINRDQYSDLLDLLEFQDRLTLQAKYIKYHERKALTEKPGVKNWKFAYAAIVNEEIRPRFECYKWENIKAHVQRSREYRSIHLQGLIAGKLTDDQKHRSEALEKKLDLFNLTYLRRSAELEAKKKKEQEPAKTWWGGVSSWWGSSKPKDDPELDLEKVVSPEEKKQFYEAVGYDNEENSTSNYPKEYVDIDLGIQLRLLDVNVWSKLNDNDVQYRIVARASIPDTSLLFRRRPATEAMAVFVDLGSFQVFGLATDPNHDELANHSRPVLAQPVTRGEAMLTKKKLLQVEFETNPLDGSADYRVKIASQSLEIKYNAPTINKLAEVFEQDTERNLQGVKQAAYSTYSDVKQRSYILMKHNIEKIKVLDIDIDLNSSYFLLPENGIYREGAPAICMDFGHLTLKRGTNPSGDDHEEAKDIDDAREKSYTQFQLKLEDVQMVYAHENESWQKACEEKNTRLHLIKPMGLELDVGKCMYSDDSVLPEWKVAGAIPNIDLRLSDTRLFQLIKHIQSVPLPQSKHPVLPAVPHETELVADAVPLSTAEKTLQTVEAMTPVLKTKEKAEAEEKAKEPEKGFEGQLTQLEASFTLNKVDLHIDQATSDGKEDTPFLCLTLDSIVVQTRLKTFDMEFQASLADFIVYHEQFIGGDNERLRLLSAQLDEGKNEEDRKLVSVHLLHTSKDNPLFLSSTYNGTENEAQVKFTKLVVMLKLEALLSILRFQDSLMKKLPQGTPAIEAKKEEEEGDKTEKSGKKNDLPATPSLKITADLEQFRIILESKEARIFDIQVEGIKAEVSQAPDKTLVNLILSDLRILDPYEGARYRQIISQHGNDKELLRVNLTLFNHPPNMIKSIDTYDCDVQVQFAKANIVFLFKHIGALLGFLDSLNITTAALNIASTQADAALVQVQKLQEQAFKVHLDITFNAPTITIPTNSFSDEALFLDLGRLTLKTSFKDDPKKLLVEEQEVRLENILASRVKLDQKNQIQGEAVLLDCAELKTVIKRLLFPQKVKDEPGLFVQIDWESVHFRLAKDDYACVMKVLMENFSENLRDQIPDSQRNEQYRYRQEDQEKAEDELRNAVIQKQKESQNTDEILPTMKIRAEIKKLALTLYLGQSDLTVRHVERDEKLKLANVQIDMLDAVFRQQSDTSYKATIRVKNFLLDDLRESNKPGSVTRMMDRYFTVDPAVFMLIASFDFKPKNVKEPRGAVRILNAKLESLYICISLDYLMILQDFFVSGLAPSEPSNGPTTTTTTTMALEKKSSIASAKAPPAKPPAPVEDDLETHIEVVVKNPQVILLEDQRNSNSNCVVLDLALHLKMIMVGSETKLYGWLTDLTVYSSDLGALKDAENSQSKVKYRILQPAKAEVMMSMNNEEQRANVRISDISVSIAPAAVRTLIGVTSALGTVQTNDKDEQKPVDPRDLFDVKPNKTADFWFDKEPVKDTPPDDTVAKVEASKPLAQQLVFVLESIEVKLEVGLGSVTKSVVAMCLSNLTADVKNWSSEMILLTSVNIEAALFNEHVLAWEPLIEPTFELHAPKPTPWCITCSIAPVLPLTNEAAVVKVENKDDEPILKHSQLITVQADQLLNLTITKTGLDLVQRLSALFNDVYNKRLPPSDDDDQPMLSLRNASGRELTIDHLHGLEFMHESSVSSVTLAPNQTVPLVVASERHAAARLSVLGPVDGRGRQEFNIHIQADEKNSSNGSTFKVAEQTKIVSINRTWERVFDLGPSANPNWPVQLLCDTQVRNDRRCVILSSIIRIHNKTKLPWVILNPNAMDKGIKQPVARIDVNEDFYVPIDLIYGYGISAVFLGIDENGETNDACSFNWDKEFATERQLKLKDNTSRFFTIFKEVTHVYLENTDRMEGLGFDLYLQPAIHITNLLPMDVLCTIDNLPAIDLKPSQLELVSTGNKDSSLIFTIPSYDNVRWVSDPVRLNIQGKGDYNEHLVMFRNVAAPGAQQTVLRMVLRVDTFHESFRLSLYSSFWVLNRTNLKLEFQIDNLRSYIDTVETPILISSDKFGEDASKKGQLRVFAIGQNQVNAEWSEKFSVDVIQNIGMTSTKVINDRTYTICVDIVTSSFGFTKLITFTPSTIIVNRSSVELELVEVSSGKESPAWEAVHVEQIMPFWPRFSKESLMRVRYADNQVTSEVFQSNQKHKTLLQMNDDNRPALHVEVSATDFDGVRIIFEDYKLGDAPLLIVNALVDDAISFCQTDVVKTQILPPLNHVYYTWINPVKARKLIISCRSKSATLELTPQCGSFGTDGQVSIKYLIFIDGVQTVLLFSYSDAIIKKASGTSSLVESPGTRLILGIQDIGLSIVNDTKFEEMFYVSLTKSKVIWTETKKSRVKPLSGALNEQLEKLHRVHVEESTNDAALARKKYESEDYERVMFNGEVAEVITKRGKHKIAKRQALDGLWVDYFWSNTKTMIHVRINRIQIDNQLEYTIFPVLFHPVISKLAANEFAEKPFIELSVVQSITPHSTVTQFQYFKVLIQEFAVKVDIGLIEAVLSFMRSEDTIAVVAVNMSTDLEQTQKSLENIIRPKLGGQSNENTMLFESIHLSPLKIHVSFSMHGSKPSDELLAEFPLVGFLLRTLNIAEVQDVILRLGCYEQTNYRSDTTKLTEEVVVYYRGQLLRQIHVLVLGLDVLGNPFGVIRGLAEGVESFFYEPYKGAIEGPIEFAEGVATGVRNLLGSAVGGAAGAFSKITGVLGKGLATLTFDDDFKASRIRRKEPGSNAATDIAVGGKNVVMGFVDGLTGVVTKPIAGAKQGGAGGFFKGMGKGFIGLVTRPTGGIVDFASTSLDVVKRTAQQEDVIRRVRYPRHVGRDHLVRPYVSHEAVGFFILNRLHDRSANKEDTYVAHITCSDSPPSFLLATSRRLIFVSEISFLGQYEIDWEIPYEELREKPVFRENSDQLQLLTKEVKKTGTVKAHRSYGKLIKCKSANEAKYMIEKIASTMLNAGLETNP